MKWIWSEYDICTWSYTHIHRDICSGDWHHPSQFVSLWAFSRVGPSVRLGWWTSTGQLFRCDKLYGIREVWRFPSEIGWNVWVVHHLYTISNEFQLSGHIWPFPQPPLGAEKKKNAPRLEVDWSHHASCMETRRFQNPCENVQEAPGCGAPYGKLDLFHCYTIFGNNDFPGLIRLPSGYLT